MPSSRFLTETYGGFRINFLNELTGGELWDSLMGNELFFNLYDFWCIWKHGYLIDNYDQRNTFLKHIIRRKVRRDPNLPSYKIVLRMISNFNEDFNPSSYLEGDWGEYFEKLRMWKVCYEEEFLQRKPYLAEPKRYLKRKSILLE